MTPRTAPNHRRQTQFSAGCSHASPLRGAGATTAPSSQLETGALGRRWAAIAALLLLLPSPWPAHGGEKEPEKGEPAAQINLFQAPRPSVQALMLEEPVVVDGDLSDVAWQRADKGTGFLQQEPDEGSPATEETEFQVAYTKATLFIAVRAYDGEPEKLIAKEMARDGELRNDDGVIVGLDTFRDRRNAFFFETNPNGAKVDALITDEGRDANFEWDGVWRVAVRRTAAGWQAEYAIPFSTLRFDPRQEVWGIQVQRRIRRHNETTYWAPVPREANLFRVSLMGELHGMSGVEPSRQFDLKPFATGGISRDVEVGSDNDFDAGLDIKWGVTKSMRLDLTFNTDFAEVEVDEQRINLTRFSLFFPEKREFFLENAGIFEFGERTNRRGGGRSAPLVKVFFSRRIGIDDDGNPVGIEWGTRLTGRVGGWNIGVLDVQTDASEPTEEDTEPLGETNFAVVRLKRNLGRRSGLGLIFTDRNESGAETNRVYGLDADFNPTDKINVNGFFAQSDDPRHPGDDWTLGVSSAYRGQELEISFEAIEIREDFEPGIGFLLREDIRRYRPEIEWSPILRKGRIRNLQFGAQSEYISTVDGTLESRNNELTLFGLRTLHGDFLRFSVEDQSERLFEPFEISEGLILPPGRYDFDPKWGLFVSSSSSRPMGLRVGYDNGGFYDGTRESLFATLTLRPSKHLRSETSATLNDVQLPQGAFEGNVYRQRIRAAINPRLLFNGLLQYNEAEEILGLNLRFNWIYRPGADLFVVFNEVWDAPTLGDLRSHSRQVILKFTYLLQI